MKRGEILIAYGTTEGQTEKISAYIAEILRRAGKTVDLARADAVPPHLDPSGYEGVVVGASIHAGRHQPAVVAFVKHHRAALGRVPTAFFSVSMTSARATEEARLSAMECVIRFEAETGFRPDRVALFAGALLYTHYGRVKRFIMKRISAKNGGPTDVTHDYEFTDWHHVERFARDFLASLTTPRSEAAAAPPG